MIDPLSGVGTGASVISLLWQAIDAVKGNESIRSLVAQELRAAHDIDLSKRKAVADAWTSQRVDYDLGGALLAWLATGDPAHADRAVERWRELLAGNRELGLTIGEIDTITAVTAASLRDNFSRAQPDEIAAIHAEAERMLHAIDASARAIDELTARVNELLSLARPAPQVGLVRFNLPTVTASFTGRDDELNRLERALAAAKGVVITQAIGGLGGIGKSQLAAAYVRAHVEEYEIVAWVGAEDGAIADLAQLAARLGVSVAGLAPSDRAQLALAYLAESEQRWLLVLDNVTSAEQLAGLLPGSGNGSVLVTSRDRALRQFGEVLTLDVFDEDTATLYLIDGAQRPGDKVAAREVARALGCLPLALSHAAAFCVAGTSFAAYLHLLEELPTPELFDAHPEASYTQTVASTWKASIQAATDRAPLADDALELAACLAPDAIPRGLFDVLAEGDDAGARNRLSNALNVLARFNLATVSDTTVAVHRLLQKVIRDDATQRGEHSAALRGLWALTAAFPGDPGQPQLWPVFEGLIPHVFALAENMRDPGDDAEALIELLNRACLYLMWAEGGRRALEPSAQALAHADRVLQPEHTRRLMTLNYLGRASRKAGRSKDAIAIFEALLPIMERVEGAEHPSTLSTRNNLAGAYRDAGRVNDAIAIFEALLPVRERVQGAENPSTLNTRNNLARAYRDAGRVNDAVAIFEALLPVRERVLGAEHPSTLSTRQNLARAYRDAGRVNDAVAIFEALLPIIERVQGAEHPSTLITRNNLAGAYRAAERADDARRLNRNA